MSFWIATLDQPLTAEVTRQIWLDLETGWHCVVDTTADRRPRPVAMLLIKDPTRIPAGPLYDYPMISTYTVEGAKVLLSILSIDPDGRGPAQERQKRTLALVRQRRGGGKPDGT